MKGSRLALLIGVVAGAALIAYGVVPGLDSAGVAALPPPTPAVPVVAATARSADFPVTLDEIGTVQAYNTVDIRAQVPGRIVRIGFTEGKPVKNGDVLAVIDPRTYQAALEQAQATLARDQANLHNTRLDLERFKPLARQSYVSAQQLDAQRSLVAQGEATVALDRAAIDNAQTMLDYTTITAPFDGVAGLREVDIGNLVQPADAHGIVVVTQIQPIAVVFPLPANRLPEVQEAEAAGSLVAEAWDQNDRERLATGTLKVIDNQVSPTSDTVRLKAVFQNADHRLWPGSFVNVHLHVATLKSAVVVPSAALEIGPDGPFAYVVRPNHTIEVRPIVAGPAGGGRTVIERGIAAGETVVTDGQARLSANTRVETSGFDDQKGATAIDPPAGRARMSP